MADDLSDISALLPKKRSPVVPILIAVAAIGAIGSFLDFYDDLPDKGPTLYGEGYLVTLASGQTWAMLKNGNSVPVSAASAERLHAKPGPCSHFEGSVENHEVDLIALECTPGGPVLPAVVDRMRFLHAKFGYWAETLKPSGDNLEPYLLRTPEVVAAVIDPRADDPQIVPLYVPLFPDSLVKERLTAVAPTVIISIRRNDLLITRYRRAPLDEFLKPDKFVFAGAAHDGGWLVRELVVVPDGTPGLERLLVAPADPPWPEKMGETVLRVRRATDVSTSPSVPDAQSRTIDQGDGGAP